MAAPHSIQFFATHIIPGFQRVLAATNLSFLLSLVTPCRGLSQRTAQHKLHATTPTSAGHIATAPPHCPASATTLRATHGSVAHDKTRPPCDDAKIGTHTQPRMIKIAMQDFGRRSSRNANPNKVYNSHFSRGASFWLGIASSSQESHSPI